MLFIWRSKCLWLLKVPDSLIKVYKYFIIYRWRAEASWVGDDREGIRKLGTTSPSLLPCARPCHACASLPSPRRSHKQHSVGRPWNEFLKNQWLYCLCAELFFDHLLKDPGNFSHMFSYLLLFPHYIFRCYIEADWKVQQSPNHSVCVC